MCQPKPPLMSDYDRSITKSWEKKSNRRYNQVLGQETKRTPSSSAFKRGWSYCWVCQENEPHKSSAPRSGKNPGSPRGRKKAICTGGTSDVARVDDTLPTRMHELHQWYLKACAEGYIMLAARIKHTHFYRGMDDIWIDFDHFWFLFHQDALDKSLVSVWSM